MWIDWDLPFQKALWLDGLPLNGQSSLEINTFMLTKRVLFFLIKKKDFEWFPNVLAHWNSLDIFITF